MRIQHAFAIVSFDASITHPFLRSVVPVNAGTNMCAAWSLCAGILLTDLLRFQQLGYPPEASIAFNARSICAKFARTRIVTIR